MIKNEDGTITIDGEKYKKIDIPVYYTMDGYVINEVDTYYWIYESYSDKQYKYAGLIHGSAIISSGLKVDNKNQILFKDKKQSIEWFYENQPSLSLKDIVNIIGEDSISKMHYDLIKQLVIERNVVNVISHE